MTRRPGAGVPPLAAAAALLLSACALFSRRPDAFVNPQLWAEEGGAFAQAYEAGPLRPFAMPYAGYLHAYPRLAAAMALAVPLRDAPAVFNLLALLAQLAPVVLLLSARASSLAPARVRAVLVALYLSLPNSFEVHMNVLNAQWHLALSLFLVLVLPPAPGAWRLFDGSVILLGALSGPFSILLVPVAFLEWRAGRAVTGRVALLAACAAIQLSVLAASLLAGGERSAPSFDLPGLVRVVGGQVVLGGLLGQSGLAALEQVSGSRGAIHAGAAVVWLAATALVLAGAPRILRLFAAFAGLVLVAAVVSPTGPASAAALAAPGIGGRYWFLPMLAFLAGLGWLAVRSPLRGVRVGAGALLMALPIGVVLDWRYPPFPDRHWRAFAAAVAAASPGTRLSTPINPDGWSVTVTVR